MALMYENDNPHNNNRGGSRVHTPSRPDPWSELNTPLNYKPMDTTVIGLIY